MELHESESLDEYLLSDDNLEIDKVKSKSCFFYFFCCCCCEKKENSKGHYINKWRKFLQSDNENISQPFRILTQLWAHKNTIKELENIRLNPNLINEKNIRNDLEFYIPQLCTFLVFGDYEVVEEFLAFLCKACYASFFFAHRILWFLQALINNSNMNEKIDYIIQLIQTIFKSEKDKSKLERLNIANSKKYVAFLADYKLLELYSKHELFESDSDKEFFKEKEREIFLRYKANRNSLINFCNRHYEYSNNPQNEFFSDLILTTEDVFVDLFRRNNIVEPFADATNADVNLLSFLGSINFISSLCDICEKMKDIINDEQMAFLRKEIYEINKLLPSNVYIPFLKDSIRNYIVCHIPVTEMRIFRTKNRAPYMITVEVIRIDEITMKKVIKKNISSEKDIPNCNLNNTVANTININNPKTPGSSKSRSFSMVDSRGENIIPINDMSIKRPNKKKDNSKSFLPIKANKDRKRSSTSSNWIMAEIQLSKPIIISNLEAKNKRVPMLGEKRIILEEKEENEESFVKDDMDEFVKRRLTIYPISNLSNNLSSSVKEPIKEVEEENSEVLEKENENDIVLKTKVRNLTTIDTNRKSHKLLIEEEEKVNTVVNSFIEDNSKKVEEANVLSYQSQNEEFQNVFGELFEAQSNRVRRTSPFGQFETWKLFKMIVKSGEDLRQEQFATQLINEFHQIFQLEKVKCWVNTYEIVATGNNVGIIECVPNAISIDQLKKKIGNNSLRKFFENYYGHKDSKSIKIHNFTK